MRHTLNTHLLNEAPTFLTPTHHYWVLPSNPQAFYISVSGLNAGSATTSSTVDFDVLPGHCLSTTGTVFCYLWRHSKTLARLYSLPVSRKVSVSLKQAYFRTWGHGHQHECLHESSCRHTPSESKRRGRWHEEHYSWLIINIASGWWS